MIRRLLFGCWRSHGDLLRTRDHHGHLVLQCEACGSVLPLLQRDPLKGPEHIQAAVRGVPITKVYPTPPKVEKPKRARANNVTPMRRKA